ncbi:MAG: hypothetical protein RL684_1011, partial [Pseudomonadota bacterium]
MSKQTKGTAGKGKAVDPRAYSRLVVD